MSISPSANTALRAVITFVFLACGSIAPWLTPVHALAVVASLLAVLGGLLGLFNLFHVPAKAVAVVSDAVDLLKTLEGDIPAQAVSQLKKVAVFLLVVALALHTTACISSAPVVPVTPANQAQVSSCQSTASWHNGVVVGDFALGGSSAILGAAGALVTDSGQKTGLAVASAVTGGLVTIGAAIAGFTAKNFANSHCTKVVGDLPLGKAKAAGGLR